MQTMAQDPALNRERTGGFYRKYNRFILNVCKGILKDPDEAREATQETFIKVLRGLPKFQGLCQARTWIYRIAVNECFSRQATRKRRRLQLDRLALHVRMDADAGEGCRTRSLLARRAWQRGLEKAGVETRKVLHMYVEQGMSQADIAASLGVSRVAVTRRIARFRKAVAGDPVHQRAQFWLRLVA